MDAGIISALITGGLALAGVIVSNVMSNSKIQHSLDKSLAATEEKINELTREVRAHNNFAQRMPVVEEQIKVINHRLEDLEKGDK
jgi:septal ring factor EnvC (AmiA/AmiB activator)